MSFSGHCGGYFGSKATCFGKRGFAGMMISRFFPSSFRFFCDADFMTSPSAPFPLAALPVMFFSFSPENPASYLLSLGQSD
tara:strand:- start:105 stop:347 length:243 start_codon:yes stop_codon:yes gene_type:complete